MIDYQRYELANGLRVLLHQDSSTPMAAISIVYNVGSKDELPTRTGFAHLFEHLMFSGSKHALDFDEPLQNAGGENNAYTNSDVTNFYNTVPAENLEIALWLESDRMFALRINKKSLEVQRKVVVEEFKETCINEPYGDVWHILSEMVYGQHPYSWPTIGKSIRHIEEATLEEVKQFYKTHYCPNNAVLAIAGNIDPAATLALVEKWFGDIPPAQVPPRIAAALPQQTELQRYEKVAEVPVDALYLVFRMPPRLHFDYYVLDLISDILANGNSARLFRRLLKEQRLVSHIDAYISGTTDTGMFVVEARPSEGVSLEAVEEGIWQELWQIAQEGIAASELEKLKNKVESALVFGELSPMAKAMNLALFEVLGNVELINSEVDIYNAITREDISRVAVSTFTTANASVLYYRKATALAMAQAS